MPRKKNATDYYGNCLFVLGKHYIMLLKKPFSYIQGQYNKNVFCWTVSLGLTAARQTLFIHAHMHHNSLAKMSIYTIDMSYVLYCMYIYNIVIVCIIPTRVRFLASHVHPALDIHFASQFSLSHRIMYAKLCYCMWRIACNYINVPIASVFQWWLL